MSNRFFPCTLPIFLLFLMGLSFSLQAIDTEFPLTTVDASGFRLVLPSPPRAIISLTLTTDELLAAIVDKDRIKAIDVYATDPGISNIVDFAKSVPLRLAADKEKIIALQPDLVLLADWKEKEFVQTLRDAGVPVFVFKTPANLNELKSLVSQIAALVGETPRGKQLLSTLDRRLNAVRKKLLGLPSDRRLTVLSYGFSGSTYGKGTSFDDLTKKAGLINVAARAGLSGWPQLSKEKILELDPDIIILPGWSYDDKEQPSRFLTAFLHDPVFAGLKAVKTNRVFVMPDKHLQATSQYMVDGVEDLARTAYPALFR